MPKKKMTLKRKAADHPRQHIIAVHKVAATSERLDLLEKKVDKIRDFTARLAVEQSEKNSRRVESTIKVILFIAILGLLISTYLTWLHYKPEGRSFCSINERFDCDAVNKSRYSEIFGIPVSILGMLGYAAFIALSITLLSRHTFDHDWIKMKKINRTMMVLAAIAFIFTVYLSTIQAFVLKTWCVMCIVSGLIIIMILILTIIGNQYCLSCRKRMKLSGAYDENICKNC